MSRLKINRDKNFKSIGNRFDVKTNAIEKRYGQFATAVHLALPEHKPLIEKQIEAEKLLLETTLREREEAKGAQSALWASRIEKRRSLDAERKRKKDQGQRALDEGKSRKKANVIASEAMAMAALQAASASAAAMAAGPVPAAAAAPAAVVLPVAVPPVVAAAAAVLAAALPAALPEATAMAPLAAARTADHKVDDAFTDF